MEEIEAVESVFMLDLKISSLTRAEVVILWIDEIFLFFFFTLFFLSLVLHNMNENFAFATNRGVGGGFLHSAIMNLVSFFLTNVATCDFSLIIHLKIWVSRYV